MTAAEGRGRAATAPDGADPELRGRTYTIPFEDVWQASLGLTGGGLRGWSTGATDDQEGVIHASSRSLLGAEHEIVIRISLDENGQTRVDATAEAQRPERDFGAASRRLRRFFRALDKTLPGAPSSRPETRR